MNNFSNIFSILMAISSIGLGLIGLVLLITRYLPTSKFFKVRASLTKQVPSLVFMISTLAIVGTLVYSTVLGLEPCKLCWYQRIIMYPIPVLLAIGFIRKEVEILLPYINIMAWLGFVLSLYQYLSQKFPAFAHFTKVAESCGVSGPSCSDTQVSVFGFVTIPMMSMFAFFFLIALISFFKTNSPRRL